MQVRLIAMRNGRQKISTSIGIVAVLVLMLACFAPDALAQAQGQEQGWFQTGTGLGVTKARVAVPEFAGRNSQAQPLEKTFHDVLWADLDYSGVLELVSPSFYPTQVPTQPSELKAEDWSAAPVNAYMIAYGNMSVDGTSLSVSAFLSDVHNPTAPIPLQKIYSDDSSDEGARRIAHKFADDIISVLTGGLPGIAETQIAYVSSKSGTKEIWLMDYDGANQHQITHLRSIALTPRWSPDATKIAFTCFVPFRGVTSAQICIYSTALNRLIAFPRFRGTNAEPAWSPDGTQIAFMSAQGGDPQIYTIDSGGAHLHRITNSVGVDFSPVWNPKTGKEIVFSSDRAGDPALYLANSDGTNLQRIELPDMGYVVDPSWSPNGQLLAFAWRRPTGNFDIYVMDIVSHQLLELTRDEGRNERPSWAPDGRHIVFESTRSGTRQIWSMLADGSMARQLTFESQNESPSWSPR